VVGKSKESVKVKVNNVNELRRNIQSVWDELDQRITDEAIKQWPTRPRAFDLTQRPKVATLSIHKL